MQDLDAKAWEDPRHFYILHFKTHAKCDLVDNNMEKIFNWSII